MYLTNREKMPGNGEDRLPPIIPHRTYEDLGGHIYSWRSVGLFRRTMLLNRDYSNARRMPISSATLCRYNGAG